MRPRTKKDKKTLEVSAAEFKMEEARFFLSRASESSSSPKEFRFCFDAALDAIDGTKDILQDAVSGDSILKKRFGKALKEFHEVRVNSLVINSRIAAHHRARRAPLLGIIEGGEETIFAVDDHVEYVVVSRPGTPPENHRITWALRDGRKYYNALDCCKQVLAHLGELVGDVRKGLRIPPDDGKKRVVLHPACHMPTVHMPDARLLRKKARSGG